MLLMILRILSSKGSVVRSPMPHTSTRCWSRSILTPVSPPKPWASWTRLSMTCSEGLLLKPAGWPTTTRGQPSPPGRSKLLSGCSCLESWPSTLCLKAPKLSPNTPVLTSSGCGHFQTQWALFRATKSTTKNFSEATLDRPNIAHPFHIRHC